MSAATPASPMANNRHSTSPPRSRLWSHESRRLQTANQLIESYSKLTAEALLEHLDPSFTHTILPASLGMPTRDREAFEAHAGFITSIFSSFAMVPKTVLEDRSQNTVIAYCDMIGELKEFGHWQNECVLLMQMSADGEGVISMKEFVDSAKATELRNLLIGEMDGREDQVGTGLAGE